MTNSEDGIKVDEESSGELNKDQQLLDDVELPEADGSGESGGKDDDEMEQKAAEDNSKGQMFVDAIQAESGTDVKPQSTEGVTKDQMESDTSAESGTYAEPQCTQEEVTKNQVEMLSDEKNVEEGDMQSEEKPKEEEEDSVKAMEKVVKEQMDVIMELTAKVKDLEKKLLKNKNKKKMKKANKGRKSFCVVEQELT